MRSLTCPLTSLQLVRMAARRRRSLTISLRICYRMSRTYAPTENPSRPLRRNCSFNKKYMTRRTMYTYLWKNRSRWRRRARPFARYTCALARKQLTLARKTSRTSTTNAFIGHRRWATCANNTRTQRKSRRSRKKPFLNSSTTTRKGRTLNTTTNLERQFAALATTTRRRWTWIAVTPWHRKPCSTCRWSKKLG